MTRRPLNNSEWMDHMQGRLRCAQVMCVVAILLAAAAAVFL